MNALIHFFGSGAAFFTGAALVLSSVALVGFHRRAWSLAVGECAAVIGLILIAFSATPLPYWYYAVAAGVSLTGMVAERSQRTIFKNHRRWFRLAVAIVWSAGVVAEIPYQFSPTLSPAGRPTLYILGDSVAAGMGETGVETWPRLLARRHSIPVQDLSQMGATAGSALRRLDKSPVVDGIVLVEIGGNDMLGRHPVGEFERDLDKLLARLDGPDRTVVMFELPLIPFSNEYGRIQRRLAEKHHVRLIPKRIFIRVLTDGGATVDSIHLSPQGHELMAAAVWEIIHSAYSE